MATQHVSEQMIKAKLVGGLRMGGEQGLMVAGDLASTAAVAKAAVDTANAKLHVSQRTFGQRVKSSLDLIGQYDSTYLGGSALLKASMIALSPQASGTIALVF
jgi:hypothetical protein